MYFIYRRVWFTSMSQFCTKLNVIKVLSLLTLIKCCLSERWQTRSREANWTLTLVQKNINQSIVYTHSEQPTVRACASWCTWSLAELGLSLYYDSTLRQCLCNTDEDKEPDDLGTDWIVYGLLNKLVEVEDETKTSQIRTTVWPYKSECIDLLKDSFVTDGIYSILSFDNKMTYTVCDMINGGWTVIQRRFDGSEEFYRDWNDYRYGFGNRTGEYWLGLENIHRLTKNGSEMTLYVEAYPGNTPLSVTLHYSQFYVDDLASNYALNVSGYTGNCGGGGFEYVNGFGFTTYDNDNDASNVNCASYYETAGWFNACYYNNLNGKNYDKGKYKGKGNGSGIQIIRCWFDYHPAKSFVLKIRKVLHV